MSNAAPEAGAALISTVKSGVSMLVRSVRAGNWQVYDFRTAACADRAYFFCDGFGGGCRFYNAQQVLLIDFDVAGDLNVISDTYKRQRQLAR